MADGNLGERERLIDEMLDREAIRNLATTYAHSVWTSDFQTIVSLFASDGCCELPEDLGVGESPVGHEALMTFFVASATGMRPFYHSHQVDLLADDRAKGFVYGEFRDSKKNNELTHMGCYEDDYVKQDGIWKFQNRKFHMELMGS